MKCQSVDPIGTGSDNQIFTWVLPIRGKGRVEACDAGGVVRTSRSAVVPTVMSERQRILVETIAARDRAEALLEGLVDARSKTERHLAELGKPDAMRSVTGRSAMDNAIASTQRMVESLERALQQLKRGLSEEDLAELHAPESDGRATDGCD